MKKQRLFKTVDFLLIGSIAVGLHYTAMPQVGQFGLIALSVLLLATFRILSDIKA